MVNVGKGAPRARRLTELLETILGPPADPEQELETVVSRATDQGHRVLVFVLYKKEATDIGKMLVSRGFSAVSLQGDMSQSARSRAMQAFRDGDASVLVATDVAARGLDVAEVTHVINFSFGLSIENYVHRVGRCGRAGRKGEAITFFIDGDEKFAPELLELQHRSAVAAGKKAPVPSQWLREMAVDVVAKEKKRSTTEQKAMTEEEEEELERRLENRDRQRQQQQQKKAKERAGRGGDGKDGANSNKAWRKNKKKR
jgi:superfamily II DNA/RNA helicase